MPELEQLTLDPAVTQPVFSRAIRSISATMLSSIGGRPIRFG
jgi:hypothetical protein